MALVATTAGAMAAMTAAPTANLIGIADSLRRKKRQAWERFANCLVFPMPFPKGDPNRPQLHPHCPRSWGHFSHEFRNEKGRQFGTASVLS